MLSGQCQLYMVDGVEPSDAELFLDFQNSSAIYNWRLFRQLNFSLVKKIIAHFEMLLPHKHPGTR